MNLKVLVLCAFLINIDAAPSKKNELFELPVVHLNDFHARFEEINIGGSTCKVANECIGGFSRVFTAANQLLKKPNAIFLNAGDNFQGTIWYNIHKWNVTQYFLNKLPTDAYTLGNHEFDNKISGLVPFIRSLDAPTVVANIDDSLEPDIQGTYQKSTIIERAGRKIGIIGVIAKNTNELSSTEKLKFTDELTAVNKEALNLHNQGCKIIIVLSHSGYDIDVAMARHVVPHVNLIVGGHSHSLLYTGTPPSGEKAAGPYPTIIEREDNRNVLVVQASSYTKYLGNLTVWYDDDGNVVKWDGKPVFLDHNVEQDPVINSEINEWKKSIDEFSNRIVASTKVTLSNKGCHSEECNFGNFLSDAMVDNYIAKAEPNSWTYAAISIINSGGIRTSLAPGDITYGDIVTVAPFENTVNVGELTGEEIKEVLEFSVNDSVFLDRKSFMQFLQVSGMEIVYNLTNPIGSRVVSLKLRCQRCQVPKFEPYNPKEVYRIILQTFLLNGGDGYSMIRDNIKNVEIGSRDLEVFEDYFVKKSPIDIGVYNRIKVVF